MEFKYLVEDGYYILQVDVAQPAFIWIEKWSKNIADKDNTIKYHKISWASRRFRNNAIEWAAWDVLPENIIQKMETNIKSYFKMKVFL